MLTLDLFAVANLLIFFSLSYVLPCVYSARTDYFHTNLRRYLERCGGCLYETPAKTDLTETRCNCSFAESLASCLAALGVICHRGVLELFGGFLMSVSFFLPRDAVRNRGTAGGIRLSLSVCPPVTFVYCIQTAIRMSSIFFLGQVTPSFYFFSPRALTLFQGEPSLRRC